MSSLIWAQVFQVFHVTLIEIRMNPNMPCSCISLGLHNFFFFFFQNSINTEELCFYLFSPQFVSYYAAKSPGVTTGNRLQSVADR